MADGPVTGETQGSHRGIEFPTVDRVLSGPRLLQPKSFLAFLNGLTWLYVCVSLLRI